MVSKDELLQNIKELFQEKRIEVKSEYKGKYSGYGIENLIITVHIDGEEIYRYENYL